MQKFFLSFIILFLFMGCDVIGVEGPIVGDEPPVANNPDEVMPEEPVDPAPPFNHSNPLRDEDFLVLSDGTDLRDVRVRGSRLSLVRGTGTSWTSSRESSYRSLKRASQTQSGYDTQWVLMDLDSGRVVDASKEPQDRIFGASSSKVFVGAGLLDWQDGEISRGQLQLMADMLVVSSNSAWTNLQRQVGDGSSDRGRERIQDFTQGMGYEKTIGFQGWWRRPGPDLHGNELTALESAQFLHDTYKNLYPGAEVIWKILHTVRTGSSRGKKYLPSSLYVGGKTGSYSGSTYDTDIGQGVTVSVRNHIMVFYVNGTQYALTVLADTGSDETAALLAGGLYREIINGSL